MASQSSIQPSSPTIHMQIVMHEAFKRSGEKGLCYFDFHLSAGAEIIQKVVIASERQLKVEKHLQGFLCMCVKSVNNMAVSTFLNTFCLCYTVGASSR